MNINEVSILLNTSTDTLRRWEQKFNLNIKTDSRNRKIFDEEDIKKLKEIKALRDEDNGLDTITRKLFTTNAEPTQDLGNDNAEEQQPLFSDLNFASKDDLKELQNTIISKFEFVESLSEKFSRASYELGTLKAKNEHLEEKLTEKVLSEQRYLQITEGNNKDINSLKNELEKTKQENELLKKQLEDEKKLPWYKRLFK